MTDPVDAPSPEKRFPVIVVGAGPAGLSVSARLSQLGIGHAILEQGQLGDSWRKMPLGLRLVSPWWTNVLAWRDVPRHPPFSMVAAEDYARYLETFARRHRAPVIPGCRVESISRNESSGVLQVATSDGAYVADAVVNATGYFSNPTGPVPATPDDGSVPQFHAAHYPGAEALKSICAGRPVLIVGRRISAGQLMVDLADNGQEVALSTRSTLEFRRDGFAGAAKDFIYYFYEELLMKIKPELRAPSFPAMDGGRARELVEHGVVHVYPKIERIQGGTAHFQDGRELQPGAIVLATGYRPALPSLAALELAAAEDGLPACEQWQANGVTGLYFLGLDNRMNYRSRTIRGIRSDAAAIANRIHRQLTYILQDARSR